MYIVSASIYYKASALAVSEGLDAYAFQAHASNKQLRQNAKYIPIELLFDVYEEATKSLSPDFSVRQGKQLKTDGYGTLNLLNHFLAYHVLSGADFLTSFDAAQLESLSLFFMDAHRYGYLLAGGFFGLHIFLLGYQIKRSKVVPAFFGWMLCPAAAGYLF